MDLSLSIPVKRPDARHRLMVFHHACGTSISYHRWAFGFPADVEVWLVDLPGRGKTADAPALDALPDLLAWLRRLAPHLPARCALFGHSMGALVAYCLAREMTLAGHPPAWIGASAANSPFTAPGADRRAEPMVHRRSDGEIIAYLATLGGTPAEIAADPHIRAMLLKLARADFAITERFFPLPQAEALPSRLAVFAGDRDPLVSRLGLQDWRRASLHPVTHQTFDGDHFYLMGGSGAVQRAIARALDEDQAGS